MQFEDGIIKCITPLQIRGDKGSENRLITKHMVIVLNGLYRGFTGGRSTRNARIEHFWIECNVNATINFKNKYERLESLG